MAYQQPAPQIQGWMGPQALSWLYEKAREMQSVVEIGSWKGRSTHALLSGCKGPVFSVDHFQGNPEERDTAHKEAKEHDIFPIFWENVGHFKNLVAMRMESVEAGRFFAPRSVDMIFIDGSHMREAVLVDLMTWKPKCRKLLCGHDIGYSAVKGALELLGFNYKAELGNLWSLDVKT